MSREIDGLNITRLALNEACEPRYAHSPWILQPLSSGIILPAVICCVVTLWKMSGMRCVDLAYLRAVCAAQLAYQATHFYIHCSIDMAQQEQQGFFNPILVLHFGNQASTLAALYFKSFKLGFLVGMGSMSAAWAATGMIYPVVWIYVLCQLVFRWQLGPCAVGGTLLTGVMTAVEVRMCDVKSIRAATGAFPYHVLGDFGQALTAFVQCAALLRLVHLGYQKAA
mmetsp:Transcript_75161/g.220319  ORF Transcript_75161/g.220319 Transcript_75161/m.220319 type:complete len:225 (+) Transcript_75161:102-776(+)